MRVEAANERLRRLATFVATATKKPTSLSRWEAPVVAELIGITASWETILKNSVPAHCSVILPPTTPDESVSAADAANGE